MTFDFEPVFRHFPELSDRQRAQLSEYAALLADWNEHINLVSRSDVANLPQRHVLHSMAIGKLNAFAKGTRVLDVGTGGGLPGIPLAILFPAARFHLVDSIGKKIKVVADCLEKLEIGNATCQLGRAESLPGKYDFVVARAVTQLPKFMDWIRSKIRAGKANPLANGVLYLKGGDLAEELSRIREKPVSYPVRDYIDLKEFDGKFIVHVPKGR